MAIGTVIPIGTLLLWAGAGILALLALGAVGLYIANRLAGLARTVGGAIMQASGLVARSYQARQHRLLVQRQQEEQRRDQRRQEKTEQAQQRALRRVHGRHGSGHPHLWAAPLHQALAASTDSLSAAMRGWMTTASGDHATAAANRRALTEAIVIGLFWAVASLADLSLTYARLTGGDASTAYSSNGDANWTIACVFVASVGLYASVWLAATGAAGHTAWFGGREQRVIQLCLYGCVALAAVCALSLGLETQEAADGIDDPILRDVYAGGLVLNTVGAVAMGKVAVSRLVALVIAGVLWGLWLPLAGASLVLRMAHGPMTMRADDSSTTAAPADEAPPLDNPVPQRRADAGQEEEP